MFNIYFSIAAILVALGIIIGVSFSLLSKKRFLGGMWAAILVGILGAFLGSIFWNILGPVLSRLTNAFGVINLYPPLFASILTVFVYRALSHKD